MFQSGPHECINGILVHSPPQVGADRHRHRLPPRASVRFGYASRVVVSVELTESQVETLRHRARALGVSPEQLACAAVLDLLSQPAEDFTTATAHVLSKNLELYRRLA